MYTIIRTYAMKNRKQENDAEGKRLNVIVKVNTTKKKKRKFKPQII